MLFGYFIKENEMCLLCGTWNGEKDVSDSSCMFYLQYVSRGLYIYIS